MFGIDDMVVVLGRILEAGIDFVVIGGTVVQLGLKARRLEGDLDLFALSPSPLLEEEVYRELAEKEGWGYSYTALGTPRLIARGRDVEVPVEFYENIHDFYVPPRILEEAPSMRIRGLRLKVLSVEDYAVLKARAGSGEDLAALRRLASEPRLRMDSRRLRERAELFEDEAGIILRRLRDAGFRV